MFSFRTTPIEEQLDKGLRDGRVGVFCTRNCWDVQKNRYLYDIFRERGNLAALFMPDGELTPDTGHIDFSVEEIRGLNAVVVEIQDVGSRYFNYTRDVFRLMSMLSELDTEAPSLYVVDHINPAGRVVEGTIPVIETDSWVPRIAHRHALTLGELCHLYYSEIGAKYPLHVISAMASASNRELLPWTIAPSSDIPGLFTCSMYSGGALWNDTTVTPAIGTARPYEYLGAPFIRTEDVSKVPAPEGVMMRPCSFTPTSGRYALERCFGYQIMLSPGAEYHSFLHTLQLMRHFSERYSQFEFCEGFFRKLADPVVAEYLKGAITFDIVQEHVKAEEQKWVRKARRFILYDDAPYRIK